MMSSEKKLAEALDQHLADNSQKGAVENPQLGELQETAAWLRQQAAHYDSRPGYVASTRQYIEDQISQGKRSRRGRLPMLKRGLFYRSMWVLFIVLSLFLLSNSVALAAESALPGDGLYRVKTLIEATRLVVTLNPVADADLRMEFAQEYLVECATLISAGRIDDARVALQSYDRHMVGAARAVQFLSDQPQATRVITTFNKTIQQDVLIIENLFTQAP